MERWIAGHGLGSPGNKDTAVKRAAILTFSGVLVLLGVIVVLPSFIDWNHYRSDVAAMLETATGREITLGGLSFRLLPQPTLRAGQVEIANRPGGESPYLARLEALDVRIELLPLLGGNINIQSLGLVAPHLVLETLPDGRVNWTLAGNERPGGAVADVHIESLTISNGTIDYRDLDDGRRLRLAGLDATLQVQSLAGPFSGAGEFRYRDVPVAVDFESGRLDEGNTPTRLRAALTLPESGARASFSGRLQADRVLGTLSLEGDDLNRAGRDVSRLAGAEALTLPAAPFTTRTEMDVGAEGGVFDSLTLGVAGEELDGRASATIDGRTADLAIDLSATRIDLDKIRAQMPETSAPAVSGAGGDFGLPANVTGEASLAVNAADLGGDIIRRIEVALALKDQALQVKRASALFPGGADIAVSGTLRPDDGRPRFTGELRVAAGNVRDFLTWTGSDVSRVPPGRLVRLDLTAGLDVAPRRITLDGLDLTLDNTEAAGRVTVRTGQTPAVTADLALDRLAVDSYLPPADPGAAPFDPTLLSGWRADLALKAERLSYGETAVTGADTRLQLADGSLQITRMAVADFAETRLAASGRIKDIAGDPAADLSFEAAGNSAGRFLSALGYAPPADQLSLGAFALDGTLEGDRAAMTLDVDGRLRGTAVNVAGRFENAASDPRLALEFRAANPSLAALLSQFGAGRTPAVNTAPLPATVTGRLDGTAAEGTGELRLEMGEGRIDLAGSYAAGKQGLTYDVKVTGTQPDPAQLARALGYDYRPAGPVGPAEIDMTVTGEPETIRFSRLDLRLGDMRIAGSAALDRTAEKPFLEATLEGSVIDLNALMPPAETGVKKVRAVTAQSPAVKSRARWSRAPIDWSGLRSFNADVKLIADGLDYATYRFEKPRLSLTVRDGALEIAPLTAGLFGGKAELGMTMAAGPPARLDMNVKLRAVSVETLLSAMAGNPAATGTASFTGDFSGTGGTQHEMIRDLDGKARFSAKGGGIRNIDLPRLSAQLNKLSGMADFLQLADSALAGGETPYKEMSGTVSVKNGIARTTDTTADIAAGTASLTATADLPGWTIDGRGVFRLTDVDGAPPVTVGITGPIDNPNRSVNVRALRNFVAARLLKRALGNGRESGLSDLLGWWRNEDGGAESLPLERLLKKLQKDREPASE